MGGSRKNTDEPGISVPEKSGNVHIMKGSSQKDREANSMAKFGIFAASKYENGL